MRASGTQLLEARSALVQSLDAVVHEEDLAAARDLALDRFAQHVVVPARDEGADGAPVQRRRGDQRQITQAADRHLQRARDRRGAQREHVDLGAQLLDALLVGHAEALLFVHDQQAELLEVHVLRQHAMGADHDVELALLELRARVSPVLPSSRSATAARSRIGYSCHALAEGLGVLLREHRGRAQHRDLATGHRDAKRSAHGDLGLAEADVAADHAVHRRAAIRGRRARLRSRASGRASRRRGSWLRTRRRCGRSAGSGGRVIGGALGVEPAAARPRASSPLRERAPWSWRRSDRRACRASGVLPSALEYFSIWLRRVTGRIELAAEILDDEHFDALGLYSRAALRGARAASASSRARDSGRCRAPRAR